MIYQNIFLTLFIINKTPKTKLYEQKNPMFIDQVYIFILEENFQDVAFFLEMTLLSGDNKKWICVVQTHVTRSFLKLFKKERYF